MYKSLFLCVFICAVTCIAFPNTVTAEPDTTKDIGVLLGEAIEDINFQSFDLAEQKLSKVLKVEPTNAYAKFYMASLLYQTKRSELAIPYLEDVLQGSIRFEGDEKLLASAYLATNQAEKAIPIYKKILETDILNEESIFQYALALEKDLQTDSAIAYYKSLRKEGGAYTDAAQYQIANINMSFRAYKTAKDEFGKINPDSAYGPAAKSYMDSLSASLKPLSLYISYEYFFNDNPGSAASTYAKGAVAQGEPTGSNGSVTIAVLSSAAWEISMRTQAKMSYTYYGTKYSETTAEGNAFTGHFFAPSISYFFSPQWNLEIKPEYQIFKLGGYDLSKNYGGTLTMNYASADQLFSSYFNMNYFRKRYNEAFGAADNPVNMQYLDANSPTFGGGARLVYSDVNAFVGLDYSLLLERPLENTNAILNEKAQDSVYREHNVTLNHHLPFTGFLAQTSLDISLGYAYRNYLNPQSGTSLPSIKAGNYLTAQTKKASIKVQQALWQKIGLNLTVGSDWAQTDSAATELAYTQKRYYAQLSASF